MDEKRNTRIVSIARLAVVIILFAQVIFLWARLPARYSRPEQADTQALPAKSATFQPSGRESTLFSPTPRLAQGALSQDLGLSSPMLTETPTFPILPLPLFPKVDVDLHYNAEDGRLYTPDERPVYSLDSSGLEWIPVIPDELLLSLGSIFMQRSAQGEWFLSGTNGPVYYQWDPGSLVWVEIAEFPVFSPTPTSFDCPLALPSRLAVGMKVRVLSELNLRASPGFDGGLVRILSAGVELEVIGGPLCKAYQDTAIVWWEVSRADDLTGWAAEGSYNTNLYFLEPIP